MAIQTGPTYRFRLILLWMFFAFSGAAANYDRAGCAILERIDSHAANAYLIKPERNAREDLRRPGTATKKLAIVIPVYRELSNGNFFRLLDSLNAQTLPSDKFEAEFV